MKALAFSPDDRYSSAGELKRDLDRYLKGEPVRAQTLTTAYWLKRHVARHSTEWIAGLAIVLMVLIGGLAWGVQRTQFIDEQV
jgi:serine/threonine-protein kinase